MAGIQQNPTILPSGDNRIHAAVDLLSSEWVPAVGANTSRQWGLGLQGVQSLFDAHIAALDPFENIHVTRTLLLCCEGWRTNAPAAFNDQIAGDAAVQNRSLAPPHYYPGLP